MTISSNPVITSVSPSSASAGTNTEITINGTGFGNGYGDVAFFYQNGEDDYLASGKQNPPYTIDDIISWSDTQIRVRVPVGSYNPSPGVNTPVSPSSGYLRVIHQDQASSENFSFSIPFSYKKEFWYNLPIPYLINTNSFASISGAVPAIQSSTATWDDAIPQSLFSYNGDTNITQINGDDGINVIFLGPTSDFVLKPDSIGHTLPQYDILNDDQLVEVDTEFNAGKTYITSGNSSPPASYDLRSAATHEFGHWLALMDLYGGLDANKVMNGNYANRLSLTQEDSDGVNWIYNSPVPTVTSLTPASTETINPVNVDITGTNFRSTYGKAITVTLSKTGQPNIIATNVNLTSSTHITCTLPISDAEPGSWNVTIKNFDDKIGTLLDGFTISPSSCNMPSNRIYYKSGIMYIYPACPPFITGITPATGLNTGPVSITNLSGENFNTSATVMLTRTGQQNISATNVNVISPSVITCTLPITGRSAGQWNVVVTNPDGQNATLLKGFTITSPSPGNTPIL